MLKITLDHNCIIALENGTKHSKLIREIISDATKQCFIVNIGASEMRQQGIVPERYDLFEELLKTAGVAHLPRLDPMGVFGLTFFGRCRFAGEEDVQLKNHIENALFPQGLGADVPVKGIDSREGRRWLNRWCDVMTMWCHIHYRNDAFLTADKNFRKTTKMRQLIAIGAGRICRPDEV